HRGDQVRAGQVVGTARGPVHFGARAGDAYLDPAALFGGGSQVHLVPERERRPLPEPEERSALERFLRAVPRVARAGLHAVAWAHQRVDAVNDLVATPFSRVADPGAAWGNLVDEARGWSHYAWSLGAVHQPV